MKKSICILTSLALIVCALFAVVGCGDKEDTRSSRELDSNILNIWQDAYGSVWVELENYEHDGYQFVNISSQSATSIDFSLDGGKTWHLCDVAESLFPEKDRGVYQIISPGTDGTFTFQLTGAEDNQFPDPSPIYNAGDVLSITIRVPRIGHLQSERVVKGSDIYPQSHCAKHHRAFCIPLRRLLERQDQL